MGKGRWQGKWVTPLIDENISKLVWIGEQGRRRDATEEPASGSSFSPLEMTIS